MYSLALTPEEQARAYIQRMYRAMEYALSLSPKTAVTEHQDSVVFKFTGIGSKYTHHIYVEFKPLPKEKCGIFTVKPAYPMYLLAVMAPLSTIAFPALVLRVDEEVRGLMVEDLDIAVSLVVSALTKYRLLDPDYIKDDVNFEGLLYSTPAGYIAFSRERKEFEFVDTVEGHVEDDDPEAMLPSEYFASRFGYLWVPQKE